MGNRSSLIRLLEAKFGDDPLQTVSNPGEIQSHLTEAYLGSSQISMMEFSCTKIVNMPDNMKPKDKAQIFLMLIYMTRIVIIP